MKVGKIKEILNASILSGDEYLDKEVKYAFSSDLMSDVLAFVDQDTVLLTGLNNPQVIRTAEMIDLTTVVFVRGKIPTEEVLNLAKGSAMIIMCTNDTMYTASGKLYSSGLEGLRIKRGVNQNE